MSFSIFSKAIAWNESKENDEKIEWKRTLYGHTHTHINWIKRCHSLMSWKFTFHQSLSVKHGASHNWFLVNSNVTSENENIWIERQSIKNEKKKIHIHDGIFPFDSVFFPSFYSSFFHVSFAGCFEKNCTFTKY